MRLNARLARIVLELLVAVRRWGVGCARVQRRTGTPAQQQSGRAGSKITGAHWGFAHAPNPKDGEEDRPDDCCRPNAPGSAYASGGGLCVRVPPSCGRVEVPKRNAGELERRLSLCGPIEDAGAYEPGPGDVTAAAADADAAARPRVEPEGDERPAREERGVNAAIV